MRPRNDEDAGLDALLLAAGYGKRMRPLTAQLPKALLPVCGQTLLDRHLAHLWPPDREQIAGQIGDGAEERADRPPGSFSIRRVVVNGHHLADQLARHLEQHAHRARLVFSHEPTILGTGGGIARAASFLQSDPFLVINCDALFRPPLAQAVAYHQASGLLATLILIAAPRWASVYVTGDRVCEIRRAGPSPGAFAFTGCHVISQALLPRLPTAGFHDIIASYDALIPEGQLGAFIAAPGELPFLDVGTPADYLAAHALCGGQSFAQEGWIDPTAQVEGDCEITGSVVLANAHIASGSRVRHSIIGPGARASGRLEDQLLTLSGSQPIAAIGDHESR